MVMSRGGNRKTKYHKCPKCGKKKYYVRCNPKTETFWCQCQYCQYSNWIYDEVRRLWREED